MVNERVSMCQSFYIPASGAPHIHRAAGEGTGIRMRSNCETHAPRMRTQATRKRCEDLFTRYDRDV